MVTKLIVALDFSQQQDALALVDQLDTNTCALKIGLEMFTLFGAVFVRQLVAKGFNIFLDLKFHDIPNTVAQACKAAAELGIWMMTLHAAGGVAMMAAAKKATESFGSKRPLLVAVTVLTSMAERDLPELGISTALGDQVNRLALLTQEAGLDGVVCSAYEVPQIKASCGHSFLTVTPGIRLLGDKTDDQARVMTATQAKELGSDYLVVGRSITAALNPAQVVQELLSSIETHV